MSLIGLAVYSTEENGKDIMLERTLKSLADTVDFSKHRLMLSVNGYTERTKDILWNFSKENSGDLNYDWGGDEWKYKFSPNYPIIEKVIWNDSNIGTAEAINKIIKERRENEFFIKMDDDIVIHESGWVDKLEKVFEKESKAGIVGLKRKDLSQSPYSTNEWYKTELIMLPHTPGEEWIIVEKSEDIMGSCTMFSPKFLDKVGYMRQPKIYGFDDSIFAIISILSGFNNYFLPQINIDHIDPGNTDFQHQKERIAEESWAGFHGLVEGYKRGVIPIYYNPFK